MNSKPIDPLSYHRHITLRALNRELQRDRADNASMLQKPDGEMMTVREARRFVANHWADGYRVMPLCTPAECPRFDWRGGGCPGHPPGDIEEGH